MSHKEDERFREQREEALTTPTPQERFWKMVNKTDGCWLWTGSVSSTGYGNLFHKGMPKKAHRYSWALHNGPIPEGMNVLHKCDTPLCVRPDHLFLGTIADNNLDMLKKRRYVNARIGGARTREIIETVKDLRRQGVSYDHIGICLGMSRDAAWRIVRGAWRYV